MEEQGEPILEIIVCTVEDANRRRTRRGKPPGDHHYEVGGLTPSFDLVREANASTVKMASAERCCVKASLS